MCTRILRTLTGSAVLLLVVMAIPAYAQDAGDAGAAKPGEQPVKLDTPDTPAEADSPAVAVEPPADGAGGAEQAFQRGVALYKKDLYREALTEFNRALALDPNHEQAKNYADRSNSKLHLAAGGADTTVTPTFETFDAESIDPSTGAQQTAEELKKARIKELIALAARYEEAQKWDTALQIYDEVRLQDPKNAAAIEGIHRATIGRAKHETTEAERRVEEQHHEASANIAKGKLWPEGAGADGIKQYKFAVPEVDEKYEEVHEKTQLEETLESPVSIEFEDIHIQDVVNFIVDTYSINVVLDSRAVEAPQKVQPAARAPRPAPACPGSSPALRAVQGPSPARPARSAATSSAALRHLRRPAAYRTARAAPASPARSRIRST
jgi:tetratricopeptide (TPR) repeat protein